MVTLDPLKYPGPLKRGDKGEAVARLQGWLNLWGMACDVDWDFGPETEKALCDFQRVGLLDGTRHLTPSSWKALTAPLARARAPLCIPCDTCTHYGETHDQRNGGRCMCGECRRFRSTVTLGEAVARVARQWLAQSVGGGPLRELPGNSGPVVEACTRRLAEENRLPCFCGHVYGSHGVLTDACLNCPCVTYAPDWRLPWCAGWVSTVLRQACDSLGVEMPIKGSLSCDVLAEQAHTAGLLWHEEGILEPDRKVKAGDLFLVRGERTDDWTHCGVVLEVLPVSHRWSVPYPPPTRGGRIYSGGIRTAEGNTNANGSRNGDRLLERVRPLTGLDFICWRGA